MTIESLTPMLLDVEKQIPGANERLFTALYAELHQLAQQQMRASSGLPLSPTTLLHETYLAIASGQAQFPDRSRFMSYASRAMRHLIIDLVRERRAQKRGGNFYITSLDSRIIDETPAVNDNAEVEKLSSALDELATVEPRLAEVVDLKYFCGFSLPEIAAMRDVSERTVQRDWDKARVILFRTLRDVPSP